MIAPAEALQRPEHDDPGSASDPFGVAPHRAEDAGEADDAEQHHPAVAEHVRQPAAERERRGQRQQVGIDHPLRCRAG